MRRTSSLVSFAVPALGAVLISACGLAARSEAAAGVEPVEIRFERLADGVWMHTSFKDIPPWGPFPTNGLLVEVGESEAVMVDTAWDDAQTAAILDWSHTTLGRSVSAAVLTHAHDDKMGGVGVLRRRGIATYAHAQSNELAPARGLVPAEFDFEFNADGAAVLPATLPPELEIFYPGPGHTTDNLVVYVTAPRVLFGGCLIRPGRSFSLGNTADAVVSNWAQATRKVKERFSDPAIVVPSHGAPGGEELLSHTIGVAAAADADNTE